MEWSSELWIEYWRKQPESAPPKKNEISLAADSGESEPCTQFFSESNPHIALMLKLKGIPLVTTKNNEKWA